MGQYTGINSTIPPVQGGQVPLASYIGPGDIDLDEYPTHLSNFQLGGLQTFNASGDMLTLPDAFRQEGMIAYVETDQNYYRLEADLVTWILLLQTGQSIANIIRRPFSNEQQLTFNDIFGEPLCQIWEETAPIFRPALYSDLDTLLYGLSEYNQANVAAYRLWSYEQIQPTLTISYIPSQFQTIIDFDIPRSGVAVLTF